MDKEKLISVMGIIHNEEKSLNIIKQSFDFKKEYLGDDVFIRGLVEFSNFCHLNCHYCGIRLDNHHISRYQMPPSEIINIIKNANEHNYRSFVLQSGEDQSPGFINYVNDILFAIKTLNLDISITLSLGVYKKEVYKKWFELGANRYLLRIETSNETLFNLIHEERQNLEERILALKNLKEYGYQVGTGVMIGLPKQTEEDLVNDLLFMKNMDIDMVGMGPYLEHDETPLGKLIYDMKVQVKSKEERFWMSIKMIALLRLIMPTINIASSTALETIRPDGREWGVRAGANVIMPNLTPIHYRKEYHLYKGKPLTADDPSILYKNVQRMLDRHGQIVNLKSHGHSKHFKERL